MGPVTQDTGITTTCPDRPYVIGQHSMTQSRMSKLQDGTPLTWHDNMLNRRFSLVLLHLHTQDSANTTHTT